MKERIARIMREKGSIVIRIYEEGKLENRLINVEVVDKVKIVYEAFDWE